MDRLTKKCPRCGKPVTRPKPYQVKKAVFCGPVCHRAHQREHPTHGQPKMTAVCSECGISFKYAASQRPGKTCSKQCSAIATGKLNQGRQLSKGIYTHPFSFRSFIRQFFEDRCALCNWCKAPCDVCHIIDRKDGGPDILENVVMLCPNHHREFDLKLISEDVVRAARVRTVRSTLNASP